MYYSDNYSYLINKMSTPEIKTKSIAGHTFVCDHTGVWKCNGQYCGRYLVDILGASRSDIGKHNAGIAHTGALNEKEYLEIEAERDKLWIAGGKF